MATNNIVKDPSADLLKKINGTEIVYIGSKLPHGLWLEILESPPEQAGPQNVHALANFRTTVRRVGQPVKLNGSATMMPGGPRAQFAVAQGQHLFAITRVEKSFWEAWLKRNSDLECVKRGLVFALDDKKDAVAKAREGASEVTGLEAVKAEALTTDPRAPVRNSPRLEEQIQADQAHLDRLYDQVRHQQAGVDLEHLT